MIRAISMVTKMLTFFVLGGMIFFQFRQLDNIAYPCNINVITPKDKSLDLSKDIERKLRILGAPSYKVPKLTQAVKLSTLVSGISHNWILAIMYTEAPEFKLNGTSNKGYSSLMGTPRNKTTREFADVDTLHGVHILEEKLIETHGNMLEALTLYKGGNNPAARKCAMDTYRVYQRIVNC
jgi:hypothetical protein